jgi:predicted permease
VNPALTKLAALISAATRLPLLAVPLFLAVGAEAAGTRGLLWGLLCVLLTSGLSLFYLFYLARSGKVRDPRSISRAERVRPLRAVAALHVGAFLVVTLLGAPAELRAALLSYALATLLFALLTPLTNLSLHAAGVSGTAVCLIYVFGVRALPAVFLVPLVWWARTLLGRHTPPELALGVLVGGGATWVAFQLTV